LPHWSSRASFPKEPEKTDCARAAAITYTTTASSFFSEKNFASRVSSYLPPPPPPAAAAASVADATAAAAAVVVASSLPGNHGILLLQPGRGRQMKRNNILFNAIGILCVFGEVQSRGKAWMSGERVRIKELKSQIN
jgi:hypothetical protein